MADVVSFAAHSRRVGLRLKRLSKMHGGRMERRTLVIKGTAALALGSLAVSDYSVTSENAAQESAASTDKRKSIDSSVDGTLERLYAVAHGSREQVTKSRGVLVFPSVVAAGSSSVRNTAKAPCLLAIARLATTALSQARLVCRSARSRKPSFSCS